MKNVKLLNDTLEWIKANPKNHDQGDWIDPGDNEESYEACNTTMCFAGHAAILAGATFDKSVWFDEYDWAVDFKTGQHIGSWEDSVHVSIFAADRLGLNDGERYYLYSSERTIQQIEEAVSKFAQGYSCTWTGEFYKEDNNA